MSSDADIAIGWLQARQLSLPAADAGDIVRAVRALERAIDSEAASLDMMQLPGPFQGCLQRLAPGGETASIQAGESSGDGWSIANLASGNIGSEEWIVQCLANIDARAPGRLAWVEVNAESALQQARALDRERAHGRVRGPLHGVPVGIKDMFDQQGRVARWGSAMRSSAVPARADATIVERLTAAGAVILGFQHMAEFAMSPTGLNAGAGPGRNPWNVEHVSGGSSSGGGMSVGAGHVPLAIGSDTGGSIRLPAALCGVTGFKPTQYRVSLAGAMPLSPSMDCIGPLARSAIDCGWAYCAIAGGDARDPSCLPLAAPRPDWMTAATRPLRVALPDPDTGELLSAAMHRAFDHACKALREAGVECIKVPVPDMALYAHFGSIVLAVESAALHRQWLNRQDNPYGRQVRRRLSRGLLIAGFDYFDCLRLRAKLLEAFLAAHMGDADAIVLPVTPDVAPLVIDTTTGDESALERKFSHLSMWTRGINYLGLPALAVPAGTGAGGLPLAVQFVGRPLGEARILALGRLFQECTDWHARMPMSGTPAR